MKIDTVEQRLLRSIRSPTMNPDVVHYLVGIVKQQLDASQVAKKRRGGLE